MQKGSQHHEVPPPSVDRCEAQASAGTKKACARARAEALTQVRKLYVDDQVCIDTQHPLDTPSSGGCEVRGFIAQVQGHDLEVEIRNAPDDSKYKIMDNWWFDEAALADVQLRALGYTLPSDANSP